MICNLPGMSQTPSADPDINILMQPGALQLNTNGNLNISTCNNGNKEIVANSLRITITIGTNAEILSLNSATSDSRWTVLSNTTGTNNTFILKNTGGTMTKITGANPCAEINLTVKATVATATYSTITGTIGYIAGTNPLIGGAQNASQGNSSTSNDNSTTSLIVSIGAPLPITLSEFTASKINCTANLVWKTSSESNGDRFEVEVSTNGNAVYTKAGTVAAAGNSSTPKTYSFSYAMQPGTTYYFRLKMIDKDGSYKYSEIRSSNCTSKGSIVIAPNPVINSFTIRGMEAGRNVINIYAANGQLVKAQISNQVQDKVYIYNLAPGLYAVKVMSEKGNMVVEKIIKK